MQQFTLPAKYYTDPDRFREEMEHFFCSMWVCAGRAEQIPAPGDYFLVELANESIIVTRDVDSTVRAFYNVCRHRGTRMCQQASGKFAARIQCPYHGWTYALDGQLLGAPHMQEANFRREDYPLYAVQAEIWDGHIFLNLAKPGGTLSAQLGALPQTFSAWRMQDLRNARTAEYEVKANWKLLIQNYNECLHCPVLHPLLNRITDYNSGENAVPHPGYIGGSLDFRGAAQTMSIDGQRRRDYLPGLSEAQRRLVLYYAIYPNLFLSLHPDYVMVHRLWPQAVDRTRVVTEWLFHPSEIAKPDFELQDVVEFWDKTNQEDWAICELSQMGISSRAYQPGPYSAREGLPQAFDRMILASEKQSRQS
jgi:glycine betaine catabolism A